MNSKKLSEDTVSLIKQNYPCYYFDADILCENIQKLRTYLEEKVQICYSVKANPFLIQYAAKNADCIEVCSFGELKLCKEAGIDETRIVVGGIYKSDEELEYIAGRHYRCISVESMRELEILSKYACQCQITQTVLLRLSGGNQFGMNEDEIIYLFQHSERYPHLHFQGIHYYSGTAKKNITNVKKDISNLKQILQKLRDYSIYIEYGPGIGFPSLIEKREWYSEFLSEFKEIILDFAQQYPVTLELGRMLASDVGCYVTRIVDIRERENKVFYIVRGGIHHISYYGQGNGSPVPYITYLEKSEMDYRDITICGELCTAHDILSLKSSLPKGRIGDFLVFHNTGAYSVTEARALFLSHPLPSVLITDEMGTYVARELTNTYPINTKTKSIIARYNNE